MIRIYIIINNISSEDVAVSTRRDQLEGGKKLQMHAWLFSIVGLVEILHSLILMLNYHRTVNILRLGMIRDLLFIGPWKTKKTTTAYSITSFPQFFNMLRFCILSLSFVLNCHGTVSPLHFRPIWHFSFLTPSKEWQCIVWLFSPHFRTCWDFAFYPLLSRGTIIGQSSHCLLG